VGRLRLRPRLPPVRLPLPAVPSRVVAVGLSPIFASGRGAIFRCSGLIRSAPNFPCWRRVVPWAAAVSARDRRLLRTCRLPIVPIRSAYCPLNSIPSCMRLFPAPMSVLICARFRAGHPLRLRLP